jgi:hypothetical protein
MTFRTPLQTLALWAGLLAVVSAISAGPAPADGRLERIRISRDGRGFARGDAGAPWIAWGVNYDHDAGGRLLEDYWQSEWRTVEADFREIRGLGANAVRIHLQFGRFMTDAATPDRGALARLRKLIQLAETTGLYLDLTGLGCYHRADVPPWYDRLEEGERWEAQAVFWEAVAGACARSPAVFCYDLMNEPVAPAGEGKAKDWLGPPFGDKHFVQYIALETRGRTRPAIARAWIGELTRAIRRRDKRTLITVGLVDWSLDRPGLTSGFVPHEVAGDLDFLCVHLYPRSRKSAEDLATLAAFQIGKPLVLEEVFPLGASPGETATFIRRSREHAAGWFSFYWGKPANEYRTEKTIGAALTADWLDTWSRMAPEMLR